MGTCLEGTSRWVPAWRVQESGYLSGGCQWVGTSLEGTSEWVPVWRVSVGGYLSGGYK